MQEREAMQDETQEDVDVALGRTLGTTTFLCQNYVQVGIFNTDFVDKCQC